MRVTEEGALYRQRCQHILAAMEEAELLVTRRASEPLGTLRVTAPTFFGSNHLAPLIARYEATYPSVCVRLSLSGRVVDLASEGSIFSDPK